MTKKSSIFSWISRNKQDRNDLFLLSDKTRQLLTSPHLLGNFFHYRYAISILGLDYNRIFKDGRLDLDSNYWADFSALNFQIGPPKDVIDYLRKKINSQSVTFYPPDLITPLRDIIAKVVFKRKRDDNFEVIGTEGAQAAMAYAIFTLINPGDEVIITDPGYFFFEPPILLAGGRVKKIILNEDNDFRINPADFRKVITKKTKMLIVCDPINPFGTIQTEQELREIVKIARAKNILILNNITHSLHRLNSRLEHVPISALENMDLKNLVSVAGMSHGYGMAGLRIGFLAASPRLLRPMLLMKSAITRVNINILSQYASLAALQDKEYFKSCGLILRRNFDLLKEIINESTKLSLMVEPSYGFFASVDTSKIKASCQELTVALLKKHCAVYSSDGLGDYKSTSFIRINFSTPFKKHFYWLRKALPEAIHEAETRKFKKSVIEFFKSAGTERARKIIQDIRKIR